MQSLAAACLTVAHAGEGAKSWAGLPAEMVAALDKKVKRVSHVVPPAQPVCSSSLEALFE